LIPSEHPLIFLSAAGHFRSVSGRFAFTKINIQHFAKKVNAFTHSFTFFESDAQISTENFMHNDGKNDLFSKLLQNGYRHRFLDILHGKPCHRRLKAAFFFSCLLHIAQNRYACSEAAAEAYSAVCPYVFNRSTETGLRCAA
jgi:hypothetical protein